ncbi:hypothetical protein OAA09_00430 [bacterium]|nr:hypothetical protein [bacterium]
MKFSFKNTGQSVLDVFEDKKKENIIKSQKPFGIMTPLRHGDINGGIFEMNYKLDDQLADNLRNLIQTNHGERLGHYDFGANLRPLSLELMGNESFEQEAMSRIAKSTGKYLPFINLKSMTILKEREKQDNLPQVIIRLDYSVSNNPSRTRRLDVIVNLAG